MKIWFISIICLAYSYAQSQGLTAFQVTYSHDSMMNINGYSNGGNIYLSPNTGYTFQFGGVWIAPNSSLSIGMFEFRIYNQTENYRTTFSTGRQEIPAVGYYGNATRFPFQGGGNTGLEYDYLSYGYNNIVGWFNILEFEHDGNTITSLAVDFYQQGTDYAQSRNPWEFGSYRFNSSIPISVVPEPNVFSLMILGIVAVILKRK